MKPNNNRDLDFGELQSRLDDLGITKSELPAGTLRRWSAERLIPHPRPEHRFRRRGRFMIWPEETVVEAAAVWAVRHSGIVKPKVLTNERIYEIKKIAWRVYKFPVAFYVLPDNIQLTGPNPQITYSYTSYKMKVVQDDDKLSEMVVTWIAAREKAQRYIPISQPKKVVFHWKTIIKPPDVAYGLTFTVRGIAGECMLILSGISLEEPDEDNDELVFLLDGTDSRKKVMYAPFDYYSPHVKYDPLEAEEKTTLAEEEVELVDIEAAKKETITIPLLKYWKLVQCRDVLEDATANRKDITHEKAELALQRIDPGEYDPDAPILVRLKK